MHQYDELHGGWDLPKHDRRRTYLPDSHGDLERDDLVDLPEPRREQRIAVQNDNYLDAVSCTGPTDCLAVGYFGTFMSDTGRDLDRDQLVDCLRVPTLETRSTISSGCRAQASPAASTAGEYYNESSDTVSTLVETGSFPPPTITSFSPTSGSPGTVVTIHGTNLQDAIR